MSIVMCRAPFRISFFGGGSDLSGMVPARGRRRAVDRHRQVHLHLVPLPAAVPRHQAPRGLALCRAGRLDCRNSPSGRARGAALSRFRRHPRHRAALSGRPAVALGHGVELDLRRCAAAGAGAFARDRGRPPAACRDGDRARTGPHERNASVRRTRSRRPSAGSMSSSSTRTAASTSHPICLATQRERDLLANLMLFFPGRSRFSSDAAISVTQNLTKRSNSVRRMVAMVEEGVEILRRGDLARLRAPAARSMGDEARPERSGLLARDRRSL